MRTLRLPILAGLLALLAACADDIHGPFTPDAEQTQTVSADTVQVVRAEAVGGKPIPGSYIVVLKEDANPTSVAAVAGVEPDYVYEHALTGFAATLNRGQLRALTRNPNVEHIEENQEVTLSRYVQRNAPWGLDRINQRSLPLDGEYTFTYTGRGIYAYVIDTGLQAGHPQFGSRARNVYDAFGGNGNDCNGHGTHVAGTIGADTYGVAKRVNLRGMRVLDCGGGGSMAGITAAVDWLRANAARPAVANMSLGGGFSSALNSAVNNLADSGVFVASAAGNESQNACNVSPASASRGYTVAASTSTDSRASYSNFGSCVNVYAPGSSITSTWTNSGTRTISGTSMAAPHVAGTAVLVKDRFGDASSAAIGDFITRYSTTNVIRNNVTGTPNRLLYKFRTEL